MLETHKHAVQTFELLYNASENAPYILNLKDKLVEVFQLSDFVQKIATQYPIAFCDMLSGLDALLTNTTECDQQSLQAHHTHRRQHITETLRLVPQKHSILQSLEHELVKTIRQIRQLHMAEIAILDLLKAQTINTSLLAVSHLANCLINATYDALYAGFCKRYGNPNNQPLIIMGMGKLGGHELNFSSDIDLIFAYPSQGETDGKKPLEHQVFFTRLAQKIIYALDHITEDGRVYRVDMRLRPLGDSGPLVLPFSAIENYYHEQGREWERFALQKMRIINDTAYNEQFMAIIKPFIYRKYIDFTTLESIKEMKTLIEKEVRRKQIVNNIKLSRGGIREVEFFVQSIQLIHGGRNPECQKTSLLDSLVAIQKLGLQGSIDLKMLEQNYLFLRRVEHYLQIFNDEQTQLLPSESVDQHRLSRLLGESDYSQVIQQINSAMDNIHEVFASIIDDKQSLEPSAFESSDNKQEKELFSALEDCWQLDMTEQEMAKTLMDEGLELDTIDLEKLIDSVIKFKKRVSRSNVSTKAIKSIDKLLPTLLFELLYAFQNNFHDNFLEQTTGVFTILNTIIGRVTYIDLLIMQPKVRERLLHLCQKSTWVSEQISQYPLLLDELLHPIYLEENQSSLADYRQTCIDQLHLALLRVDPEDQEQVMNALREFKHVNQLRIAASDLSATLAINQVSDRLTILAEVILEKAAFIAYQQISNLFGQPKLHASEDEWLDNTDLNDRFTSFAGLSNLAIVAYGKFGGIELSYGSDLDIVFLHNSDLAGETTDTGTRKQISNQEFYIKLVQRICHICTTKTYSGILYDIDLRLRPSGNAGLLISHINSFNEYQQNTAWTWEHQALVRSRAVFGSNTIVQDYNQVRLRILGKARDKQLLQQQVYGMREKMRTHLLVNKTDQIDIKQASGGIVDLEFIVQYLVLAYTHTFPELAKWSDNLRLLESLNDVGVIEDNTRKTLTDSYLTIRHVNHRVQLSNKKFARGGQDQNKALKEAMAKIQREFEIVFAQVIDTKCNTQLDSSSFEMNPDFFDN